MFQSMNKTMDAGVGIAIDGNTIKTDPEIAHYTLEGVTASSTNKKLNTGTGTFFTFATVTGYPSVYNLYKTSSAAYVQPIYEATVARAPRIAVNSNNEFIVTLNSDSTGRVVNIATIKAD